MTATNTVRHAYAYARRNPSARVYLCMGSSQGEHLWHIRADGSKCCEDASFGGFGRPTRRQFAAFVRANQVTPGTTVVFFGLAGNPLRGRRRA